MKEAAIGIIVTFIIIVAIVVAIIWIVKALIRTNHLKSRKQVHKEELDKTKIQDL
ncbi:MAG: hypothetical protein MSH32_11465 [Lachnospiraceae bacterium]|nr:hypothetical protein [Lachnospiraceae bacterium]